MNNTIEGIIALGVALAALIVAISDPRIASVATIVFLTAFGIYKLLRRSA